MRSDLTFDVVGRGEADPARPSQVNGIDDLGDRPRDRRVPIVYAAE